MTPPPPPVPTTTTDPFVGMGADCILDPAACGVTPGSKPGPTPKPKQATSARAPDQPSGRTTLAPVDVRTAIAPVKSAAKACGLTHGAASGEKVGIKLSIDGQSGRVTQATPQSPHGSDALGRCVAGALRGARFPTFAKPSMGLLYRVTM